MYSCSENSTLVAHRFDSTALSCVACKTRPYPLSHLAGVLLSCWGIATSVLLLHWVQRLQNHYHHHHHSGMCPGCNLVSCDHDSSEICRHRKVTWLCRIEYQPHPQCGLLTKIPLASSFDEPHSGAYGERWQILSRFVGTLFHAVLMFLSSSLGLFVNGCGRTDTWDVTRSFFFLWRRTSAGDNPVLTCSQAGPDIHRYWPWVIFAWCF